jgi:hypothetical protein
MERKNIFLAIAELFDIVFGAREDLIFGKRRNGKGGGLAVFLVPIEYQCRCIEYEFKVLPPFEDSEGGCLERNISLLSES